MSRPVRIGNAHGFWGDRIEAAAEMLAHEPDLDFVTLDFLAEVSMSILALQRSRDPDAGWPRDVADVIRSLVPYWSQGGRCRLITNGGGLNPKGCAQACRRILDESGCAHLTIAVVYGDDVLDRLKQAVPEDALLKNLDTSDSISRVQSRLVTANAYLGAEPIAEALARGADIVITGRVADPSLTVAACAHFHGWKWDDWDRLAGATVAGHLIECGTQVTGGISTDWLEMPEVDRIGFPIVEVNEDGSFIVTKPRETGGCVTERTVKEQLVYEIGDPDNYLSPDVTVSFLTLQLSDEGHNRISVHGARGRPAPMSYKVSATYQDGYRAQGELTIYGANAIAKAQRAGQAVLSRLRADQVTFRESLVECLGTGACHPHEPNAGIVSELRETVLRIAVADDSREFVEKFCRELMPLVTAGPPGTTGYAAGRPRVHPVFRYWPCLIECRGITPVVELVQGSTAPSRQLSSVGQRTHIPSEESHVDGTVEAIEVLAGELIEQRLDVRCLADVALTRSGDKGIHANIGVIARHATDIAFLRREVTVERVAAHLGIKDVRRVIRYELPNLGAFNFVVQGILANSLRTDAQGKTLGQVLLEMPLASKSSA